LVEGGNGAGKRLSRAVLCAWPKGAAAAWIPAQAAFGKEGFGLELPAAARHETQQALAPGRRAGPGWPERYLRFGKRSESMA
jgi:hypothetical protein